MSDEKHDKSDTKPLQEDFFENKFSRKSSSHKINQENKNKIPAQP